MSVDRKGIENARSLAQTQVSAASLTVLRICFGVALSIEALRYVLNDWVQSHLVGPTFHFAYPGLGWVTASSVPVMNTIIGVLVVLGAAFAAGWRTRGVAAASLVCWSYIIAVDRALYLNHHYLVLSLLVLWCLMPQVRRRGTVCFLWIGGVRALLLVVYVWAGVSKFDADWAAGIPVAMGTGGLHAVPWIGSFLVSRPFVVGTSWALIAIEIGAPVWLGWRGTRPWAMAALASFHVGTVFFYNIGIFPWVSLALLSTWLSPSWAGPRRALSDEGEGREDFGWRQRFLLVFLVVHMIAPARALFVGGNLAWNGGAQLASWRLLTAQKTGWCRFEVMEMNTGDRSEVSPLYELTVWQAGKLARNPEMMLTYARHLAKRAQASGAGPVQVFARSGVSLNGRVPAPVFDETMNLVPELSSIDAPPLVAATHVLPLQTGSAVESVRLPDGWWEANMWGAAAILQQVARADRSGDEAAAREMTTLLPLVEEMSLSEATGSALALLRFGLRAEASEMLERPAHPHEALCPLMLRVEEALSKLGEGELGERVLRRCAAEARSPLALGKLADRAIATGDIVDAQRWLELMVIEVPGALEPSLKLAELYATYLNRPHEARRLLDAAALRQPTHPRVLEVRRVLDRLTATP